MKRRALGVLVATLLTVGPAGAASAAPVSGGHNIQNWASAGFVQLLAEQCLYVNPFVTFIAGDHNAPLGGGRPSSWSDVTVNLGVFNACVEEDPLYLLSGYAVAPPAITSLESASVAGVVVNLEDSEGNNISATVNLAWVGNDDPHMRITQQPQGGYHRVDTVVTAQLTGTLEFWGGNVGWGNMTEFTADDAYVAEMGHAVEVAIAHP